MSESRPTNFISYLAHCPRITLFIVVIALISLASFISLLNDADAGMIALPEKGKIPHVIRMGFVPQQCAIKMAKRWQSLADYLSKEMNLPVDIIIKSNYHDVINSLARYEMDIALTSSYVYIETQKKLGIIPLVKRVIDGTPGYKSIIVTRADNNIKSVEELRGKSFAFIDKDSATGYILPLMMLRKKGFDRPESFFSEIKFVGNHESAFLAVYNRGVHGTAISTAKCDPRDARMKELKVLWESEPIIMGPFIARKDLDVDFINSLKKAFLKIGKRPETASLSRQLGIDYFEEVEDGEYEILRNIQKEFNGKISKE